jgi:cold shock CspA family protein
VPRGGTWTTTGRVERVHLARRAGTVRTEEGQTVFICARVVAGGLAALKPGDAVRLKLRRGPLGVMAVGVEACPRDDRKPGPGAPPADA